MKNYAQLNAKNVGFGLDRTEKGITLVSLVVTIVVLLILAGISLSLIMGDGGILNRATNAAKTYSIASAQEKIELLIAEASYDYLQARYVNGNGSLAEGKDDYILDLLSQKVGSFEGCELEINNNELILSKDGKTVVGTFGTDGAISWEDSIGEKIAAEVGNNDITYTPSGTYTWNAEYATSYASDSEEYANASKLLATGTSEFVSGKTNMSITKWKILKTKGNTVYLVPSSNANATPGVTLHGAQGYNNAVNLLDDACSALYGNSEKRITAESIDMDLIESLLTEIAPTDSNNTWANTKSSAGYMTQVSSPYSAGNSKYPLIYADEKWSVIGLVAKGESGLGMSEPWKVNNTKTMIERNTGTSYFGAVDGTENSKLQPYKTYYSMNNSDFSTALGKYSSLILTKEGNTKYWVASHCVYASSSYCRFIVRNVHSGNFGAGNVSDSNGDEISSSRPLFPVVSVSANLIKEDENGYYVDLPN